MEAESPLPLHELVRRILPASGKQQHSERGTGVLGEEYEVVATDGNHRGAALNTDYTKTSAWDYDYKIGDCFAELKERTVPLQVPINIGSKHCMTTVLLVSTTDKGNPLRLFVDGRQLKLDNEETQTQRVRLPRFHQVLTTEENPKPAVAPAVVAFRVEDGAVVPTEVTVQMLQRCVVQGEVQSSPLARAEGGWTVVRSSVLQPHASGATLAPHVANVYPFMATEEPCVEIVDYSSIRSAVKNVYNAFNKKNIELRKGLYATSSSGTLLYGSSMAKKSFKLLEAWTEVTKKGMNLDKRALQNLIRKEFSLIKKSAARFKKIVSEVIKLSKALQDDTPLQAVSAIALESSISYFTWLAKETQKDNVRYMLQQVTFDYRFYDALFTKVMDEIKKSYVDLENVEAPSSMGKVYRIKIQKLALLFVQIEKAFLRSEGVPELKQRGMSDAGCLLTWLEWPAEPGSSSELRMVSNVYTPPPLIPPENATRYEKDEWWTNTKEYLKIHTRKIYQENLSENYDEQKSTAPRSEFAYPNRVVPDACDPLFLSSTRVESALNLIVKTPSNTVPRQLLMQASQSSALDASFVAMRYAEHYVEAMTKFVQLCKTVLIHIAVRIKYQRRRIRKTEVMLQQWPFKATAPELRKSTHVHAMLPQLPNLDESRVKTFGNAEVGGLFSDAVSLLSTTFMPFVPGSALYDWFMYTFSGVAPTMAESAVTAALGFPMGKEAIVDLFIKKLVMQVVLNKFARALGYTAGLISVNVVRGFFNLLRRARKKINDWAMEANTGDHAEMDRFIESFHNLGDKKVKDFMTKPLTYIYNNSTSNNKTVPADVNLLHKSPLYKKVDDCLNEDIDAVDAEITARLETMKNAETGPDEDENLAQTAFNEQVNHAPRVYDWVKRAETHIFRTIATHNDFVTNRESSTGRTEDGFSSKDALSKTEGGDERLMQRKHELPSFRTLPDYKIVQEQTQIKKRPGTNYEQYVKRQFLAEYNLVGLDIEKLEEESNDTLSRMMLRFRDLYCPVFEERKNWRLAALLVPTHPLDTLLQAKDGASNVAPPLRLAQIITHDVGTRDFLGKLGVSLSYTKWRPEFALEEVADASSSVVVHKMASQHCSVLFRENTEQLQSVHWATERDHLTRVQIVLYGVEIVARDADKKRYEQAPSLSTAFLTGHSIPHAVAVQASTEQLLEGSATTQRRMDAAGETHVSGDAKFLLQRGIALSPSGWACAVAFYDAYCVVEIMRRFPNAFPWLHNRSTASAMSSAAKEAAQVIDAAFGTQSRTNALLTDLHPYFRQSRNGGLVLLLLRSCEDIGALLRCEDQNAPPPWPDRLGASRIEAFKQALVSFSRQHSQLLDSVPLAPLQSMPFYIHGNKNLQPRFTHDSTIETLCFENASSVLALSQQLVLRVQQITAVKDASLVVQAFLSRPFFLQTLAADSTVEKKHQTSESEFMLSLERVGMQSLKRQRDWTVPSPDRMPSHLWTRTRRLCTSYRFLETRLADIDIQKELFDSEKPEADLEWHVPFCAFGDVSAIDAFATSCVEDTVVWSEHFVQACNALLLLAERKERDGPVLMFESSFPSRGHERIRFPVVGGSIDPRPGEVFLPPLGSALTKSDVSDAASKLNVERFDVREVLELLTTDRKRSIGEVVDFAYHGHRQKLALWHADRFIQLCVLLHTSQARTSSPAAVDLSFFTAESCAFAHIGLATALAACAGIFPLRQPLYIVLHDDDDKMKEAVSLLTRMRDFAALLDGKGGAEGKPAVRATPLYLLTSALIRL